MTNLRSNKYQLRVNNPDAISSIDVLESIQSQYAASPNMLALLVSKAALADPGKDVMLYYQSIFDPKTAQGVGLDIWGRIVGAVRTIDPKESRWFGFRQGLWEPFSQAPFWSAGSAFVTQDLDDEGFRTLIFWKAAANIAEATAPALNGLLHKLFPGEGIAVIEVGVMHIRVVSRFALESANEAIFRRYGLLAKGAGVGVEWLAVPGDVLGFDGSGLAPFNQAPFWVGQIISAES